MLTVANELKVPFIGVSPVNVKIPEEGHPWGIAVPQTPNLMVKVIADRMKREGVKTVGFIGFTNSWGDLVYNGAKASEAAGGPKVTSNERYTRTDTSVTGAGAEGDGDQARRAARSAARRRKPRCRCSRCASSASRATSTARRRCLTATSSASAARLPRACRCRPAR